MATPEATNLVLDSAGTGRGPRILKQSKDGTLTHSFVCGGARFPGKQKWIATTTSDSDATQAAVILAALA